MSIQMALSSAMSGLKSAQQQAGLVSHNIANATTPGYVRKNLLISNAGIAGQGQGVRIEGVARDIDELLVRDARFEQSRYVGAEARASALADFVQIFGQPQDERSVSTALSQFRTSFQRLFDMPESDGAQRGVVDAANSLVRRLREASAAAQTTADEVRERLAASVNQVNDSLAEISRLNRAIATQRAGGANVADLHDRRDLLLDRISEEIGIRTYTRESGEVVVMTRNGQTLLDGELKPGVMPLSLSGDDLMANGIVISADPDRDIQSGRIKGLLDVAARDMPQAMAQLDALAASLVQGFQAAEIDPSGAGLFTDAGAPFSSAAGLAGRIAINPALDGNAWRVQSGVQTAPADRLPLGDKTQVARFLDVFDTRQTFTAPGMPASAKPGDYAVALVTHQHSLRADAEADMRSRKIAADVLQTARLNRDGVNIDEEMQKLLLIEQSYGASAQVIQAAGRMIDVLLQIGR